MARSSPAPKARDDVEVNEVDDGLVVYDTTRDRVHYLNHTASLVFVLCTGHNAQAVIAEQMAKAFQLSDGAEVEVADCLALLAREGLLV